MTCVTFGVAASSFTVNMVLKQNASDLAHQYPVAASVVGLSFYVDNALTGADSVEEQWNFNNSYRICLIMVAVCCASGIPANPMVFQHLTSEFKDTQVQCTLLNATDYISGVEYLLS